MIQLSFTIVNWLTIFLSFFGLLLYSAAGYTTNNNYYVDPPVDEPPFVDAAADSLASVFFAASP